ncbi:O-antigen ligase family protein [Actinomyces culturomici]|uniref:O-antigen ligase family protein n=1 Tax=Actinomyces culturomici TaxID=1926276 RepID=UPI000E205C68|nr:O-antigen ligase family protein [Actinomyces culturomici]
MTTRTAPPSSMNIRELMTRHRTFDVLAIAILFFGFAGQGVRNMVGFYGSGVVMAVLFALFAWSFALSGASVRRRPQPVATLLFVLLCAASLAWSVYPFHTLTAGVVTLGVTACGLALAASRSVDEITDLLIRAFQAILIASYVFELFVALVWRKKFPPLTMLGQKKVPNLLNWSQNDLFDGGPIQGFMGNRNPLAFVALLLALCLLVRWAQTRTRTVSTLVWIGVAVLTLALTRSGTVTVCLIVSLGAAAAFILVGSVPKRARPGVVMSLCGLALVLGVLAASARIYITAALGKSPDMTGRAEIWKALLPMWREHPVLGWGWVIGYPSDVAVFAHFIPREDGTPTTQAHNAYIEALFQTGVVGAVLIVLAVATVLIGTYATAVHRIDEDRLLVLPALLATALVVQSTVESRLLFEGNWLLFVVLASFVASERPFLGYLRRHGPARFREPVRRANSGSTNEGERGMIVP